MIYVNEIDPYCAQWLQNLMDAGILPAGHIDTRSIEDVTPNDLAGYDQCHFFAGLGGWIYALDLAGWPRDRPVWTGSCPCQPFSAAGKGAGFADERHLWPAWQHLIAQRKPATVFGEQVASKAVDDWIDLVHADMEGLGYAFGSVPFPSAGVGAPHIRDRNYWLAYADGGNTSAEREQRSREQRQQPAHRGAVRLADANRGQRDGIAVMRGHERDGQDAGWAQGGRGVAACGGIVRLADSTRSGRREECPHSGGGLAGDRSQGIAAGSEHGNGNQRPGPLHSFWRDTDWLGCTDGKWRPVEPGTFPLAHGIPGRVGRLRAYGNAINPHQAAEFVAAFMNADVRQELAAA